MPYEPLHHKYRPQSFAELVGQEAIATTLSNALRQRRIAPAYLFTGARGTGKTSSARIFAKSLNCLSAAQPTPEPCGQCQACRDITRGSSLDVIEIDAASNTGVDNIRELIERAQFAPVQCRYKVYVIDEVHMLSNAAFNALLKTLEEPPDRVVFVLATTDPQRVLPTIISRCQRFDFRRIPLEAMAQHLRAIAQKEAIPIQDDAVQLVSQIAQGGLRDAESLLDQLSLLEGDITTERVWDLVGAVPERDLLDLVRAIAQSQPESILDSVRRLMDRGREPLIVLQNLTSFYRDLLIAKTAPSRSDLVAITAPTWADMCALVQPLPSEWLQHSQRHLQDHEIQVRNSSQPRLWLEVTLMGLLPTAQPVAATGAIAVLPPPASPTTPVRAATAPAVTAVTEIPIPVAPPAPSMAPHPLSSAATANSPSAPTQPLPVPAPDPPPAAPTQPPKHPESVNLDELWQQVLAQVKPFSTQTMLRQQCRLLDFKATEARIGVNSQPLFKMAKDRLPNIEAAFKELTGTTVRVSLEVAIAPSEAAPAPASAPASTPVSAPASTPAPSPVSSAPAIAPSTTEAPAPAADSPSAPAAAPTAASSEALRPVSSPRPEGSPTPVPTPSAPPPTEASPTPGWIEEDEVLRAAKSFADMFNGQIVNFDDSSTAIEPLDAPATDLNLDDDDDNDLPF
ncbi:MAG: DNA polymerase III subunit gamma/tau [Kaiparowitsia implicata GSE-PSE-MK54-09C]|jgi:DNA polymerase-3 subunit gamma/tau|nr:DNA polymerase III subunit gamma/tau [Kaiparowitsia implicata GSE-PSE-MK54-09C]